MVMSFSNCELLSLSLPITFVFPLLGLVLGNLVIVRNDPELSPKRHNKLNLLVKPRGVFTKIPLGIPRGVYTGLVNLTPFQERVFQPWIMKKKALRKSWKFGISLSGQNSSLAASRYS